MKTPAVSLLLLVPFATPLGCDDECAHERTWSTVTVASETDLDCLVVARPLADTNGVQTECNAATGDGLEYLHVEATSTCDGEIVVPANYIDPGMCDPFLVPSGAYSLTSDTTPNTQLLCLDLGVARVAGTDRFSVPFTFMTTDGEIEDGALEFSFTR